MSDPKAIPYTAEQVQARRRRLAWGVLGVAALLVMPQVGFFREEFWSLTLGLALASGMVGLSINLLTGYAGQISLGHAALFGTGAYATAHLTTLRGLPYWLALPLGALITGVVVLIVGFPALRVRGLHLAIVTLGFQFLMYSIVFRLQPITGGSAGIEVRRPEFLGQDLSDHRAFVYVVLVSVLALLWLDRNVTRTKAGRAFFAIREDEQVAASFGIDVARYKLLAFSLSGIYAGLAGGLFAGLITFVTVESFYYQSSLEFLAYAVIGGLGSRAGTMIGAMIPVFFQQLQVIQNLRSWGVVIGGVLLVLTLVRYRGGLAEQGREIKHLLRLLMAKLTGKGGHGAERTLGDEPVLEGEMLFKAPEASGAQVDLKRHDHGGQRRRSGHLLEVRDVAIRFGGVQALGGVSLDVRESEIVGIMGPNGAGKTTLFNCITGFVSPNSGTVRFMGRDISSRAPHARAELGIGRTFQNIGLVKSESVEENLLIAQHTVAPYGAMEGLMHTAAVQVTERMLRDRARYVTSLLGLDGILDQRIHDLPHGLLKMVELGCALVTGPELLLLDEPSSGMSPQEADELGDVLTFVRDTFGVTILMIEHHVPLVLDVADYVYVLNFGTLLAEGEADGISSHPEVVRAYLGGGDEDLLAEDEEDIETATS